MKARLQPRLVYLVGFVVLAVIGGLGARHDWAPERELYWIRGSGWCALLGLLSTLCVSPLAGLIGRFRPTKPRVAPLRRALGITSAALASLHAGVSLGTYLGDAWWPVLEVAWLRAGLCGVVILAALWLTSFPRAVRVMRVRLWKPLHRLAYGAAAFAFLHTMLSPFAPRSWILGVFLVTGTLALTRLWPSKTKRRAQETQRSAISSQRRSQPES